MKTIEKVIIGILILAILVLASYIIRQNNEYPVTICSANGCLKAKKANFNENCVATERGEVICGDFILRVKKGIEVNNKND